MKIYWIGLNWITNSIKLPYQQLNLAHLLNLLKPTPVPHPQQYLRWHQIRMGETKTKKRKKPVIAKVPKTTERDSEITSILVMLTITMVIMILMKIIIINKYMNYQRNVMQYYYITHWDCWSVRKGNSMYSKPRGEISQKLLKISKDNEV